jgi:hypothetical protein
MRAPTLLRRLGKRALAASTLVALTGIARLAAAGPVDATGESGTLFRLPWAAGASQYLTQDANDDCCSDHVGANKFAYDFALPAGGAFEVVAPASGTIVHVKMSSNKGCADATCVSDANYVVIDHGDGTQTTMLHLAQGSLDPALTCGGFVRRGQHLATTGSTGWSTGVHLHVERDQVKKSLSKTCECGADGMACAPNAVEWSLFWPSTAQPNLAVTFEEWKSAVPGANRRGLIGPSRNGDDLGALSYVELDRASFVVGDWTEKQGGHKGTYRVSKAATGAAAAFTLKGVVAGAGPHEIWAYLPLSPALQSQATELTVDVRTKDGTSLGQGTLDETAVGGAYHPVRGLERVKLTGNETIVVSASDPDDAKLIAVDGLMLRRIVDENVASSKLPMFKDAPTSSQLGIALAPKGGGVVVKPMSDRDPSTREERAVPVVVGMGAAGIAALVVARRRKRSR